MVDQRQTIWHRRKLEAVFRLAPGTLEHSSWVMAAGTWEEAHDEEFPFWYAQGNKNRVVLSASKPPDEIYDPNTGEEWYITADSRVKKYGECPEKGKVTPEQAVSTGTVSRCPYCENVVDNTHGTVYIGETTQKYTYTKRGHKNV